MKTLQESFEELDEAWQVFKKAVLDKILDNLAPLCTIIAIWILCLMQILLILSLR